MSTYDIFFKDVHFRYGTTCILNGVDWTVPKGAFYLLQGANGSGKSTLIQLLLGLLIPNKGTIEVLGTPVYANRSYLDVGYVPQVNRMKSIAFPVTCMEFVLLGLYGLMRPIKIPSSRHKKIAFETLKQLGMENYAQHPFYSLSGGQQQRVMIARALVHQPKLLILDEPTVGIDQEHKKMFYDFIHHLHQSHGITIVIVSHDTHEVSSIIDAQFLLSEGKLRPC